MPQQGRTFRVFVSSTFSDLKAERNALQRYVFPRLRALPAIPMPISSNRSMLGRERGGRTILMRDEKGNVHVLRLNVGGTTGI